MSRKQLMLEMDAGEVLSWMAYELSIDPDKSKTYMSEISRDKAKPMDDEERSRAIKEMFNFVSGIK